MGSARSPSQCSRLPTPCIAPKAGRADAAHAWPAYPHAPCKDRTPGGAVQCLAEHRPCPRARHTARAATALLERLPTLPSTGKKTPGGAGTHTGHTGNTGARGHRTDHTDEPHNHPPKLNDTPATTTRRPKPLPTQQPQEQPQARSRPLPAADYSTGTVPEPDSSYCTSTVLYRTGTVPVYR